MRVIALSLLGLCAQQQISALDAQDAFKAYQLRFAKSYVEGDVQTRLENFQRNVQVIEAHNLHADKHGWTMGLNAFSDLSDEEFSHHHLMAAQDCSATAEEKSRQVGAPVGHNPVDLPAHVDWRMKGIVSEVKNQAQCGSCWTFSSVGALEAHMAMKYDVSRAPRLSEQQLVDCAGAFDTKGCAGGLPSHAFEYIRYAGGIATEFSYPYHATDGKCVFHRTAVPSPFLPASNGTGAIVPGGAVNLTQGDEHALKYHLAMTGPVSIAFQVASDFRHYTSGVYSSKECKNGPKDVNHAVLAVGYGTMDGVDYWTVKNSWDYIWGHEGYFKIKAFENMCGVAQCNSYPDLYGNAQSTVQELVV